jgi:hypothetical protein
MSSIGICVYNSCDVLVGKYPRSVSYSCRNTGGTIRALNMGSYNYLGFSENRGACADASEQATREFGIGVCSTRHELGNMLSARHFARFLYMKVDSKLVCIQRAGHIIFIAVDDIFFKFT